MSNFPPLWNPQVTGFPLGNSFFPVLTSDSPICPNKLLVLWFTRSSFWIWEIPTRISYSYTRMVHRGSDAVVCGFFLLYQGDQIISASLQVQYIHCRNVCNFLRPLKYIESATLRRVLICFWFSQLSSRCLPVLRQTTWLYPFKAWFIVFCPGAMTWYLVGSQPREYQRERTADQAAKSATRKTRIDIPSVPLSDVQAFLKRSVLRAWQTEWHNSTFKLSAIKNSVYPWRSSSRSCRREEVILTRLRIGHCHFSHVSFFEMKLLPSVTRARLFFPWNTSCCTVGNLLAVDEDMTWATRYKWCSGMTIFAFSKTLLFFERKQNL